MSIDDKTPKTEIYCGASALALSAGQGYNQAIKEVLAIVDTLHSVFIHVGETIEAIDKNELKRRVSALGEK